MPGFTAENARELGAKGHAARRLHKAQQEAEERARELAQQTIADRPQLFAKRLECAMDDKLDALCKAKEPREAAALAKCLRDLRETYHLVTGEARPGIKKGDGSRRRITGPSPDPTPAPDHNEQPPLA